MGIFQTHKVYVINHNSNRDSPLLRIEYNVNTQRESRNVLWPHVSDCSSPSAWHRKKRRRKEKNNKYFFTLLSPDTIRFVRHHSKVHFSVWYTFCLRILLTTNGKELVRRRERERKLVQPQPNQNHQAPKSKIN